MTIERMIELLEIEHECMLRGAHDDCDRNCADCELVQDDGDLHEMYTDVITLLKAQEARVMTLDEVKAFDWDYCYLEEERLPGKVYRTICGDYALTCITWPCVTSMRTQYGDENYGRKWRCWSAKPTNEQRKTAKWG